MKTFEEWLLEEGRWLPTLGLAAASLLSGCKGKDCPVPVPVTSSSAVEVRGNLVFAFGVATPKSGSSRDLEIAYNRAEMQAMKKVAQEFKTNELKGSVIVKKEQLPNGDVKVTIRTDLPVAAHGGMESGDPVLR